MDPEKWKRNPKGKDLFSLEFCHADYADVVAFVNAEARRLPLDQLVDGAVEGMKGWGLLLKSKERRIVSGKEVVYALFQGILLENNHAATFLAYYYSGREGAVQIAVGLPTMNIEKYREDAEAFLNGLQIGDESPAAKSSELPASHSADSDGLSRFSQVTLSIPQAGTKPAASGHRSKAKTVSLPSKRPVMPRTTSSKVCGRYLRAKTW